MTSIFESFTARKAASLSRFGSVAMLDYLQRSGVFSPQGKRGKRGRGKARRYTFRDVLVLKAIKKLLDNGASVSALKKALAEFQKVHWVADPVTLEDVSGIVRYLVVSGDSIILAKDADVIINMTKKGQLEFSFIMDIDRLWDELRSDLNLPKIQRELAFS